MFTQPRHYARCSAVLRSVLGSKGTENGHGTDTGRRQCADRACPSGRRVYALPKVRGYRLKAHEGDRLREPLPFGELRFPRLNNCELNSSVRSLDDKKAGAPHLCRRKVLTLDASLSIDFYKSLTGRNRSVLSAFFKT
jgi:hypothetical protein